MIPVNLLDLLLLPMTILLMLSTYSVSVCAAKALTVYACEGSTLDIKCENGVINVIRENYGRLSKDICRHSAVSNLNCVSNNRDIVKNKCSNKSSCSVAAVNSIFGDPCEGTHKYLEVEYECTSTQTTHRKHEVACEGSTLKIKCNPGSLIHLINVNYGRLSRKKCNPNRRAPILTTRCVSENSFAIVNGKCKNQQQCRIQAANSIFGDPCVGTFKYLDVEYKCIQSRSTVKNVVACEHTNLDIECEAGKVVSVVRANYGRTSSKICTQGGSAPIRTENCVSQNSKTIVNDYCSGKQNCNIRADNNVFQDPCVGTFKYLEVDYTCTRQRRLWQ